MKVQILGTGAIYSKRNCASLIIDKKILFDIGPGTIKQLLKENYDLKEINTILISHLHSDHILDFPIFIVNLEVLNINHKVRVIGPVNMKEKLLKLLELMYGNYFDNFINKNFEFIEVKENNYDILYNNYKINMLKVNHEGIEAYGFIINDKLGLTGDSSICDGVKKIFSNSKIIVADCSLIKGDNYHMGFNDIKNLLKENKEKIVMATHLRDDTRELLVAKKIKNFNVVEDGYYFDI